MPEVIVDDTQVVQVEHEHGQGTFGADGLGLRQDLLALVLVGKARCLVKVHLALQLPVQGRGAQGADKLDGEQRQQAHDIGYDDVLQVVERGGLFLRVFLRQPGGLVAELEEALAFRDDVGVLVTDFAHALDLGAKVGEAVGKLGHLRLVCVVVKAHQVQVVASVAQSVDVGIHGFDHLVLRKPRVLHFHDALRGAAHQSGVVHHARGALNVGDQRHDVEEQEDEHDGERRHEDA